MVVGLVAAVGLGRAMSGFLFGISSGDPVTFGEVAILLTLIVLAACYLPARRATAIEPTIVLRQ